MDNAFAADNAFLLGVTKPVIPGVRGDNITVEDIKKLLALVPVVPLTQTQSFLHGDHWQKQLGWIGWTPESTSRTVQTDWRIIQQGFQSKNVIKQIVKRLQGATLGKEPDWQIVSVEELDAPPAEGWTMPSPSTDPTAPPPQPIPPKVPEKTAAQKEWQAVDALMTQWWEDKHAHDVLKKFIYNCAAYGKASLQIYVPKGYLKANNDGSFSLNIANQQDLEEVLCKIYIDAPGFANIINAEDTDFGEDYVCLRLGKNTVDGEETYEVHYVDEKDQTHLRQVSSSPKVNDVDVSVDLGRNLLTFIHGNYSDALISEPVKSQQKSLNHALTMESYAVANINFPETTFINAEMETEDAKDPEGKSVKVVKPLFRGLGRFMNLVGITTEDANGGERIATPDVKYKDTADPKKFAEVAVNCTRNMHEEASMLYVVLASSPYPSGDSRVEAMTDYLILLVDFKTLIDQAGHWLLQTVLRLAFNFTNQTQKNDQFAVLFSTKLTIGRMSPADKEVMLQEVAAQLRSRRNYMVTAEVSDDPAIEEEAIRVQKPLPPAAMIPPAMPTQAVQTKIPRTEPPPGGGG